MTKQDHLEALVEADPPDALEREGVFLPLLTGRDTGTPEEGEL